MIVSSVQNPNIETKNEEVYSLSESEGIYSDMKTKLKEIFENIISKKEPLSFNEEINNKFLELDFGSEFNIDATKIGINDAIFFVNLLNQENLVNYTVSENGKLSIQNYEGKNLKVTNSLLNLLKTSLETKKPIRLDFDKDVTVILKLDREGKIQAHFIPGNPEVEAYLKNNISSLKQVFEDENISYSYLGYSQNKNKNNNKKKKEQ